MDTNTTMQDIKEYIEYLKLERQVKTASITFDEDKCSIVLGEGEAPMKLSHEFYNQLP